jgi:hypothetical protein
MAYHHSNKVMLSHYIPAPETYYWPIAGDLFQECSRKPKQEIRVLFTRGRQPAFEADLR